jgi:hypothetical protein
MTKQVLRNDKQVLRRNSSSRPEAALFAAGVERPLYFVLLPGTLKYRGFSAAQDDEACPASVEMTVCIGRGGEANADSSAALRNDNQERQMQIPPLRCGMTKHGDAE